MRPEAQRQTMRLDSGVTKSTAMTISSDAADAVMVLQNLTDMYSNRPLAGIREIATNAADAHYAAGQTRPIEVTLPNIESPNFVVQDWGTGLNWDNLENIYAKFGRSTKRDTNTQTGMLGFGCKAPLTYCLSFTVVGIKDGVKTVAVVSKGDNGIGTIKQLGEVIPTEEPNGVTVTMPVPREDITNFNEEAKKFFSFWREGVLVNGSPPEVIKSVMELDPDLWILDRYSGYRRGDSYIVQGNVPYPYPTSHDFPPTVAWVEIGSVAFPPSREALQDSPKTDFAKKTIREYIDATLDRIIAYELEITQNSYERWRKILELRRSIPNGYKHPQLGFNAFNQLRLKNSAPGWHVRNWTASKIDCIDERLLVNDEVKYITNFPLKGFSPRHKEMVAAAGIEEPYVVVPSGCGIALDGFPGRRWGDIPPLPKAERVKSDDSSKPVPRTQTLYAIYVDGERKEIPSYDGDLPVLYVDNDDGLARSLSKYGTATASIIAANQEDRFRRLHPGAKEWRDWMKSQVRAWERRLTKRDLELLGAEGWHQFMVRLLGDHASELKDPHLRKLCNLEPSDHFAELRKARQVFANRYPLRYAKEATLDQKFARYESTPYRVEWPKEMMLQYPLLSSFRSPHDLQKIPVSEWVIYLNARFKENKKAAKAAADNQTADAA